MAKHEKSAVHLSWTAVTYRSVIIIVVLILVITGTVGHIAFPEQTRAGLASAMNLANRIVRPSLGNGAVEAGQQTASITQFDGTVRVKKASSNLWVNADYTLPLEKGDVVQTGGDGIAQIVFADGTNYSLKQDSLIVIEENSTNQAKQTQVAVQLTTGTVDLATPMFAPGSRSQVIVAGATASFAADSTAMVRNDPKADRHEIMVKRGSGEVTRKGETVRLGDYERVSFKEDSTRMAKTREIAPPTLIAPANMMPIFKAGPIPVEFSWSPIPSSQGYRLRIARNPYFTSTVYDRKVTSTQAKVPSLGEGAYYWAVQSVDPAGKESVESERNRFTIIAKGPENVEIALELSPFVQHGRVIEVRGKTEPKARVMVNGQQVPLLRPDGSFEFFTPPLSDGENVITITAQNSKG
ncbi:MAG: FecR domain-containing protein, partial [Candidatus Korobacteraceae bacterium]